MLYLIMKDVISKIKEKPELRGVSEKFIRKFLPRALPSSKRDQKALLKEVRARLRYHSGGFGNFTKSDSFEEALKKHSSTRERIPYYDSVKEIISRFNPSSIIDLGCGLNPIAIANHGVNYYAYDINEDAISLVNHFFSSKQISGKAEVADITEMNFPKSDIALIFKTIDLVDKSGHKTAEEILKKIECKHIIVSFSTKTLSGKPMNHPQRGWIERLCDRLGYSYTIEKIPNEIFYIISKPKK